MKLQYKTKKWDKDIAQTKKVMKDAKSIDKPFEQRNIETAFQKYKDPSLYPHIPSIDDEGSFWALVGRAYHLWSWYDYQFETGTKQCIGHIYLSTAAYARSYSLWKSGVELTNPSIAYNRKCGRDIENICFNALAINEFPLFEPYAEGTGAEIIKAMYHENYVKARELVETLPDTKEMYAENKNFMSYYYEADFMKDLYTAILDGNEKAFNAALHERIKNVRCGYVMPIDAVSITMIKFAKKFGIKQIIDVIEIPNFFLEDDLNIDKETYKLPDIDDPVII